jgi:hypothetical protein
VELASSVIFWVSIYSSPKIRSESNSIAKKKSAGERRIFVILGMCQSRIGKRNLVNF